MKAKRASARGFADVVDAFRDDPRVTLPAPTRGAFGANALKVDGKIFAMEVGGALVMKLPRARVASLIEAGEGAPFGTAGRVMKEWVAVTGGPVVSLAREARAFVAGAHAPRT